MIACLLTAVWTYAASAQPVHYNSFGAPGLIDMPSASSAADADLAFSLSGFAGQTRGTATFQLTPRLSASLRYARLTQVTGQGGFRYDRIYDRSIGLHYQFADETRFSPAFVIGVNDFAGTGIYAGEYVVATKTFARDIDATVGLGWGRLATQGPFGNPFGASFADRPSYDIGAGGMLARGTLFHGDMAMFGGVRWQPSEDRWVILEYASDAYVAERGPEMAWRSPLNFEVGYAPSPHLQIAARYLYGANAGLQFSYALNPQRPPHGHGLGFAPLPVAARDAPRLSRTLADVLEPQGLALRGYDQSADRVAVIVENDRYLASAQAIGRTMRGMSQTEPAQISMFSVALEQDGIVGPMVSLARDDLEAAQYSVSGMATLSSSAYQGTDWSTDVSIYPRFHWAVSPYITPNLFDPDAPLRADFGVALRADWRLAPRWFVRGSVRQRVAGNLDQTTRRSDSVLPHVRSDFALYDREGDLDINDFVMCRYFQPAPDITGRLTIGLLEQMYAGVSGELLWDIGDSGFAVGAEVNALVKRDYDGGFGVQNYAVTSGHLSAYWAMGQGYHLQLDAGRYLAGDWGGTVTMKRTFANGWEIGAFATLTDVAFSDFGEGSFDKGIVVTVPIGWMSGETRRDVLKQTIRPVTRDGGARVNVDGRLYDLTRPLRRAAITDSWGGFWQ